MGKTPYIDFKLEIEDKELLKTLELMSNNGKMLPYVKETINRAGKKFLSVLKKEAYKKYKVKSQSYFNQFIKEKKATNSNLEYKAEIRSSRLNMIRFAKLENRKIYRKDGGVTIVEKQKIAKSIEIIRGKRISLQTRGLKTWFVGNKGRTLFKRLKKDDPRFTDSDRNINIHPVTTISPTQMLGRKEFLKKANKEAEQIIRNRIDNAFKNFKF
ncbi:hypothetical protein JCM11957_06950 [Caminibacter profundus]